MATDAENLRTRRSAITAELAAGQTPDGQSFRQPSLSIDGESVPTDQYVDRLYRELAQINDLLASPGIATDGAPWEVSSRGVT